MESRLSKLMDLAERVVAMAQKRGADHAEVLATDTSELETRVRRGEPELVQEAHSASVGLRIFKGGRQANTYTSDTTERGLLRMVDDAVEISALSASDELALPPEASLLARSFPELELFDEATAALSAEAALARAAAGEAAALASDPRLTNTDGATTSREAGVRAFVTSAGFRGGYASSYGSLRVTPVADEPDGKKRRETYWDAKRHLAALEPADAIGREAARRTLRRLGAKKIPSSELPVVFDPDAGRGLLSLLFSAVSGEAIYRRTSYLVGREGDEIAAPIVSIADDPLIVRGPGSRPFDGEGLPSRKNQVVERGRLQTFLFDTYSGRRLGRSSTGSAARAVGGRPSVAPSNFVMEAGTSKPEDLVRGVSRGLYVTSTMGFGFNPVTGDFSRGAEGFVIEGGELTTPVSEVTISLNFDQLWRSIDGVGDDLDLRTRFACPTFRVAKMTIAGT